MQPLTDTELHQLAELAARSVRLAVAEGISLSPRPEDHPRSFGAPAAVFVTLRRGGQLRGCIGTLEASEPLVHAVADRARAAAQRDPRFDPVSVAELGDLAVSVSVLTTPSPLDVVGYDDLLTRVRPGVDGVVVDAGRHRATFLPSVWEELPHPRDFLAALWRKAGLPPRAWPQGTRISCYTAQHSSEVPA